jgi:hypothetical protein
MPPPRSIELRWHPQGLVFRLSKPDVATVGRHGNNDWVLDADSVSRYHARLEWPIDKVWPRITDLGSANGVFVGGVRISPDTPTTVSERSKLKLGKVEIEIRVSGAGAPALLPDSSSSVELLGERGFRLSGRFGNWDDACLLLLRLEDERRSGSLRIDLPEGPVKLTVLLGQLTLGREPGVALLRRLCASAGGSYYSFTSQLKLGTQVTTGWKPSELLGALRAGDDHPTGLQ